MYGKEKRSSSHIMKMHSIESDVANLKMSDHKVQHLWIGVEVREAHLYFVISSKYYFFHFPIMQRAGE